MLQPDVASLFRLAKEAIIVWHLEGTIAQWNPSAERLYGYLADEIIGQSISRLLLLNDPDELTQMAERWFRPQLETASMKPQWSDRLSVGFVLRSLR